MPGVEITEFIEARLAEDEAMARDVEFPRVDADGYWTWDGVDYEVSWPTAGLLDKSYAGEPWEILSSQHHHFTKPDQEADRG